MFAQILGVLRKLTIPMGLVFKFDTWNENCTELCLIYESLIPWKCSFLKKKMSTWLTFVYFTQVEFFLTLHCNYFFWIHLLHCSIYDFLYENYCLLIKIITTPVFLVFFSFLVWNSTFKEKNEEYTRIKQTSPNKGSSNLTPEKGFDPKE